MAFKQRAEIRSIGTVNRVQEEEVQYVVCNWAVTGGDFAGSGSGATLASR